jgi:DeoR/GlpR family transcriptional regulator of sugar metabolism
MFPAERRRQITRYVNQQGSISIPELSAIFNVSEMTIHRDLHALESMGLIKKTRGGAIASETSHVPINIRERLLSFPYEKDLVGRKAAEFIQTGDTILLDPGTTGISIARHCHGKTGITVFTNGPLVVLELAQIPGIEVYCTGGLLSNNAMSFVGPEAEEVCSKIRPDKCFISAHAFNMEDGVTDPMPLEASFKRKVVEVSQQVYLVVTPEKLGCLSKHVAVPTAAIDVVILHPDSPVEYCEALSARGIRCIFA